MNTFLKRIAGKAVAFTKDTLGLDIYAALKSRWERSVFRRARPEGPLSSDGLNLFFETETLNSISKVGRDFAKKLSLTQIPFSVIDTKAPWADHPRISGLERDDIQRLRGTRAPYRKCILFGGVEQKQPGGYSVWQEVFYEFSQGLAMARPALFGKTKGICVFSDFCEKAVRSEAPEGFPVAKIRYPFLFADRKALPDRRIVRNRFGIPDDSFALFFNFAYGSSIERKNPEAVIESFATAFGNRREARLVLKTTGGSTHAGDASKVEASLRAFDVLDRTIRIDEDLPMEDVLALTSAMDAYISLHRGEGLGLGMLEAMSLGVPVVASAYGGNMDFTREETSFLVPCEVVPCTPEFAFHKVTRKWAKPDVSVAARHLRTIYDNPALAREKAAAGLAFVRDFYSLENFERDVRRFLAMPFSC
jgi:glycosyltransferase involved in cell wall biosynthesis